MIQRLMDFLVGTFLYIFWVLLHFLYQFQAEIREGLWWDLRLVTRRLVQCWPSYSTHGEVARLAKETQALPRIPQHIAISVVDKKPPGAFSTLLRNLNVFKDRGGKNSQFESVSGDSSDEGIDLQALAKVISWAWVANIPVVSLYDHKGTLKCQHRELSRYVQEEVCQNLWAVKRTDEPPTLKFHNVPNTNGYSNGHSNGSSGLKPTETLHICLYSNEDGKAGIVRAAKDIFKERLDSRPSDSIPESLGSSKRDEIRESLLDAKINNVIDWSTIIKRSAAKTDPDLLVILGNIKSTMGFLPWHIRLTEIHWLPPLPKIEMTDFLQAVKIYATCHQRFGT